MRRPPSNLDDFLQGGESLPADETARPTDRPKAKRRAAAPPKATPRGKKAASSASTAAVEAPAVKPLRPPVVEAATAPEPRTVDPNAAPKPDNGDRGRSRTVSGEAAATVIMSVRVPIELRERLEDILAAYSGVTFSDLVIRGLQSITTEVEARHRERTGVDLPRRQERPEFPL